MKQIAEVPGLYIQQEVISLETEQQIIEWLDTREWSTVLPRRTQHFGYNYGYNTRSLTRAESFNGWVSHLSDWLDQHNIMKNPEQCIVNEYTRDQKIAKHIDKQDLFGPRVVSVSVGADTNFVFRNTKNRVKHEIYVPRRSLMIMTGDARNTWTHEIPSRKTVTQDGTTTKKPDNYRRISLTFRTVI